MFNVCLCSSKPVRPLVAPSIELNTGGSLHDAFQLYQGQSYLRCGNGQVPTRQLPCELGAMATSSTGDNLTQYVVACAPANCNTAGCNGEELHRPKPGLLDRPSTEPEATGL